MTDPVLVSVILSVYNDAAHLPEAVASIRAQSLESWELILVDDGSTDATPEVARGLALLEPRLRLMAHPANQGLTRALNLGLAAARGRYLARQDADDCSHPERLAKQVDYLEAHPEVGLLGSAAAKWPGGEWLPTREPLPLSDAAIRWEGVFRNPFYHTSVMMRREVLVRHGMTYDPELSVAQDYDLWDRLSRVTRMANLAEPLVGVRVHPGQCSVQHRQEQQRVALGVAGRQLARLEGSVAWEPSEVAALGRLVHYPPPLDAAAVEGWLRVIRMFEAFSRQPGLDPGELAEVRRQLMARILASIPRSRWGVAWRGGLFSALWRLDARSLRPLGWRWVRGVQIRQILWSNSSPKTRWFSE